MTASVLPMIIPKNVQKITSCLVKLTVLCSCYWRPSLTMTVTILIVSGMSSFCLCNMGDWECFRYVVILSVQYGSLRLHQVSHHSICPIQESGTVSGMLSFSMSNTGVRDSLRYVIILSVQCESLELSQVCHHFGYQSCEICHPVFQYKH